ncbi:MAG: HRDC domain protein, partial [Bacilli bacterium]|nr:HRDC domain protein [Bacilli bacterium]
ILYNNNLILSYFKFANSKKELPDPVLETVEDDFINQIIKHYKSIGIEIKTDTFNKFGPFINYTAEEFKANVDKQLHLVNNAILGKFSLCSSSIQGDIKKIIQSRKINDLVKDLLTDVTELDIYDDDVERSVIKDKPFDESDINYINDLDYSQESAIVNINKNKEMVLQGPPGTGKSQTITSIIIDAVIKGKNVLMVSQKKAALDVIYSRLGNLSKYSVIIADMKDKDSFYKQVGNALFSSKHKSFNENQYQLLSNGMDNNLTYLSQMGKALKDDKEFGVPMYEVYASNFDNFFAQYPDEVERYANYLEETMIKTPYHEVLSSHQKTNDTKLRNELITYYNMIDEYPFLGIIVPTLNKIDCLDFVHDAKKILSMRKTLFKSRQKLAIKAFAKKYFTTKVNYKDFMSYSDKLIEGIGSYDDYLNHKGDYDSLTVFERLYFKTVKTISNEFNINMKSANQRLYDLICYYHISNFESHNRRVVHGIHDYRKVVGTIASDMKKKKEATKDRFVNAMDKIYAGNTMYAKRFMEIQRKIESLKHISVSRFIDKFSFELFSNIKIWLMTPEVVSEALPLENGLFDLVIFDEASQLYVEKGIPSIQRGKQVLIAGDHKQLRPSSLGEGRMGYDDDGEIDDEFVYSSSTAALEEESLLDLARFKYPEMMLNFHYRSKYAELIEFSNYAFYRGRLNISPNVVTPTTPPIEVIRVKNGVWENRTNKAEAIKVVSLLKEFLFTRKNNETVGIITFNVTQRDLISDLIEEECRKDSLFAQLVYNEFSRKKDGEDHGLFIKNIENVQGDERDYIIFSITYGKDIKTGRVVRNYGWLNQRGGENRLNVAITRAKQKIYVVTSIGSEDMNVDGLSNDGPTVFKKYLRYCECISSNNTQGAKDVLLSFGYNKDQIAIEPDAFVDEVFKNLKEAGLDVYKNIGIGNYRIDIGVKKNGKFVMGIECDSEKLWNITSTRERDIHRRKYLESRGWFVYRIWALNWYHLKDNVIDGVKDFIKNI